MRTSARIAFALVAFGIGGSPALAQDPPKGMYVSGEGSSRMVMGGDLTTGAPVLAGTNGAAPADCPDGSYYEGAKEQIFACGDDTMGMSMMKPETGAMMPNGQPYPEGSMMLESRENN